MKTFAERLKFAMERVGCNYRELGEAIGSDRATTHYWRSKPNVKVKFENAVKAAEFLRCNPYWLAVGIGEPEFDLKEKTDSFSALEIRLIEDFRLLSNPHRAEIMSRMYEFLSEKANNKKSF